MDGLGRKRQSFTVRYAFPSAASSRNRRHATQTALFSPSWAVFSPSEVFTLTIPSSTAYDPPAICPLYAVVISFQMIGSDTARLRGPLNEFRNGRKGNQ